MAATPTRHPTTPRPGREESRCDDRLAFWRGLVVALLLSGLLWAAIVWGVARLLD